MPHKKSPRGNPKKKAAVGRIRAQPGELSSSPSSPPARPAKSAPCPVAGIGASAGGLEALKQFFTAMPPSSGAAFVLIQHLDPHHESLTAELLSRHTSMSVVQVARPMAIEPDHVYVIPPNKYLSIGNGELQLTDPVERRGARMPVDFFLRSLAANRKERGIGIILSGTGTDGTLGLKEVKAAGGLTIAQDPASAQYDGMPRSAIVSGSVDSVVPLARMPETVVRYINHAYVREAAVESPTEEGTDDLGAVVAILRTRAKFDFSCYKTGTVGRRVRRRMSVRHVDRSADYVRILREEPDEVAALFKDLLINVTSFFREPKSWEALRDSIVAPLVARKDEDTPIRAWVPACATGEEAYSLGMLLIEAVQAAHKPCALQIFASDVDSEALELARAGEYPESIAADVPPERLRRFFMKGAHTYRVCKELREAVVFARQNVLADPPFSKVDLICCRNLMIYLEAEVQKKLLSLLHFALNERGGLFLGPSESIGAHVDLFETVSNKWRIYRRLGPTRHDTMHMPVLPSRPLPRAAEPSAPPSAGRLASAAQRLLLERYAPACVVITRKYEILHFSGRTHDYLVQPGGAPTQDLMALAREGLQTKLRGAVHKAVQENRSVTVSGVRVRHGASVRTVRVIVEPLDGSKEIDGLLLVAFEDEGKASTAKTAMRSSPLDAGSDELKQLEFELQTTREDLQSSVEELEASNEELKASNEEVMSVNEELQSTNEELETSKEELQSLNEELSTVNSQLEGKVGELEAANNDLNNLLVSTDLPTLFLDTQFHIRRFTPAMTRLLRLIPADAGRPIGDFASPAVNESLTKDAEIVLQRLAPVENEVRAENGRTYLRRVLPYRTENNHIDGVVVTFLDVTERKEAEAGLRRFATVVRDSNDAVTVQDFDGRIIAWNRGAERLFGYSESEALSMKVQAMLLPELHAEFEAFIEKIRRGAVIESFETRRLTKHGQIVDVWLTATLLRDGAGVADAIALTERDITARMRAKDELIRLNEQLELHVTQRTFKLEAANLRLAEAIERLQSIVGNCADGIVSVSESGTIESFSPAAEQMFGYAAKQIIGRPFEGLLASPAPDGQALDFSSYLGTPPGKTIAQETVGRRKDGSTFPMELSVSAAHLQTVSLLVASMRDVTERHRREAEVRHLERTLMERTDEERRRIGLELHDQIGQCLSGTALLARSLEAKLRSLAPTEADTAAAMVVQLRDAHIQVRDLAKGLAPVSTSERNLAQALSDLAHQTHTVHGVTCAYDGDDDAIAESIDVCDHLYRIAQEAVSNAVRHARPKSVRIGLERMDSRLILIIQNDGDDMAVGAAESDGLGLRIMRHRAQLIGADLEITPAGGGGTVVHCVLPAHNMG